MLYCCFGKRNESLFHNRIISHLISAGLFSLWLYSGPDTTYSLLGEFSGNAQPGSFSSPNGAFTLRFRSDGLQNASGWTAVYHDGSQGPDERSEDRNRELLVYPNPASDVVNIFLPDDENARNICIYDYSGRVVFSMEISIINPGKNSVLVNLEKLPSGIFTLAVINLDGTVRSSLIIKVSL